MKDEFGRPFGKKQFLETFVFAIILLLIFSIAGMKPEVFYPLILLALAVFSIGVWVAYRHKKQKQ